MVPSVEADFDPERDTCPLVPDVGGNEDEVCQEIVDDACGPDGCLDPDTICTILPLLGGYPPCGELELDPCSDPSDPVIEAVCSGELVNLGCEELGYPYYPCSNELLPGGPCDDPPDDLTQAVCDGTIIQYLCEGNPYPPCGEDLPVDPTCVLAPDLCGVGPGPDPCQEQLGLYPCEPDTYLGLLCFVVDTLDLQVPPCSPDLGIPAIGAGDCPTGQHKRNGNCVPNGSGATITFNPGSDYAYDEYERPHPVTQQVVVAGYSGASASLGQASWSHCAESFGTQATAQEGFYNYDCFVFHYSGYGAARDAFIEVNVRPFESGVNEGHGAPMACADEGEPNLYYGDWSWCNTPGGNHAAWHRCDLHPSGYHRAEAVLSSEPHPFPILGEPLSDGWSHESPFISGTAETSWEYSGTCDP